MADEYKDKATGKSEAAAEKTKEHNPWDQEKKRREKEAEKLDITTIGGTVTAVTEDTDDWDDDDEDPHLQNKKKKNLADTEAP